MSKEFVEFNFPCIECLVRAACQDKPIIIKDLADSANPRCIAMPNVNHNDKESYTKAFLECWANIGWRAIQRVKSEDAERIPPKYIDFLIDNIGLLQWIINSQSWEDGEMHDFDLYEAKRKLEKAKGWL